MDLEQEDLSVNLSEVLQTRSKPPLEPSCTQICLEVLRSRSSDGRCIFLDWSKWTCLIHPLIVLLPRILKKIREDQATVLLIAPNWKGQPWCPVLIRILVDQPLLLPQISSVLSISTNSTPSPWGVPSSKSFATIRKQETLPSNGPFKRN